MPNTTNPLWKKFLRVLGKTYLLAATVIGSYVLIVTVVLLFSLFSGSPTTQHQTEVLQEGESDQIIAVIQLSGPILLESEPASFGFSTSAIYADHVVSLLEDLAEDDAVKAVILSINSPGGSAVASDMIYQELLSLRDTKPVIAYFEEVAASGGYYIGAGASKIVAHPDSITGSIGVIMNLYEVSELYEKLGITANTIKSGEFKDIGSESRELSTAEREQLQTLVNGAYDSFVAAVATGRQLDEATVRQLGDGRLYSGKQAAELKLIDQTGSFDQAITLAQESASLENPQVLEYTSMGFWESFFGTSISGLLLSQFEFLKPLNSTQPSGLLYLMEL